MHTESQPRWTCPFSQRTNRSGSTMVSREPSEAGPRLCAPPRSKPPRFSAQVQHSGSPQRPRFGWACALCPSQVRAAQEFGERGRCDLSPFLPLLLSFLGGPLAPPMRQIVTVQNPRSLSKGACLQFGKSSLSRSAIAPFQSLRLWLPVPGGGWSAAGFFRSVLCSVLGPGGVLCSSFSRGSYPTVWFASPS